MNFRIRGVVPHSNVDGEGIRFAIFFQGCGHHCKGCHNKDSWDFSQGIEVSTEYIEYMIEHTKFIDGITLTGGDPIYQPEVVKILSEFAHQINLDVWCYTGFRFEEIDMDVLKHIDVLVDGEYVEELNDGKPYRGSSNQRLIKLKGGEYYGRVEQ